MRSKIDILTKNYGVDNDELGHIAAYIRLASGQNRLNTSRGNSGSGSGSEEVGIDMNIFNRRSDELIDNLVNTDMTHSVFKSIIKNYLYNKYAVIFYGRSDQLLSTSKHTCDSLLLLQSNNLYNLINPNKVIELLGYTAPYNLHNIKRETLTAVNIFFKNCYSLLRVKVGKGVNPFTDIDLEIFDTFKIIAKDKKQLHFDDIMEVLHFIHQLGTDHTSMKVSVNFWNLLQYVFQGINTLHDFNHQVSNFEYRVVDFLA
jgi:hypothetical protein